MANNNNNKTLNVPNLRFPEFSEEWKISKLMNFCKFYSGGTPSSSNKSYYSGTIPFIRSGELHKSNTELFISEDGMNNSSTKMVYEGDLLLALYGATSGDIAISQINGAINQAILCINTKQSKGFIQAVWQKHVQKILQTYLQGGQGNLSADIVKNISFFFTTLDEQNKLAKFISILDDRIATQNKIIEDLKKLKSSIADSMFCNPKDNKPKYRIKGYEKKWDKVSLSEICGRVNRRNTNNVCNNVLTIAAQYGLVRQEDFFNKRVASDNLENYILIEKGEFAYNKSYSADYPWGAIKRLDCYGNGVLSSLYICFRPNEKVNSDFLALYFESTKWYKSISDISVEGARNHGLLNMSVSDFFDIKIRRPSIEEQNKIAKILKAIEARYDYEKQLLNDYARQRTYLLQKMFI